MDAAWTLGCLKSLSLLRACCRAAARPQLHRCKLALSAKPQHKAYLRSAMARWLLFAGAIYYGSQEGYRSLGRLWSGAGPTQAPA